MRTAPALLLGSAHSIGKVFVHPTAALVLRKPKQKSYDVSFKLLAVSYMEKETNKATAAGEFGDGVFRGPTMRSWCLYKHCTCCTTIEAGPRIEAGSKMSERK